jgi:hypothetical protein
VDWININNVGWHYGASGSLTPGSGGDNIIESKLSPRDDGCIGFSILRGRSILVNIEITILLKGVIKLKPDRLGLEYF